MVRLMPKAKLSSLPLNHFASAVVMATISGSEPTPRRNRATSITVRSDETALRIAATVQMAAKRIVDFAVPKRSTITPPRRSTITAATL